MEGKPIDDATNRLLHLCVEVTKVGNEFKKDFGPRLQIIAKALLIQEIGNQLHCSIITIAKAQVLFHSIQRLKNGEFNTMQFAAACLNLSIKLCQENITTEDIILRFHHVQQDITAIPNPMTPDPSLEEIENMKRNLCHVEYAVCKEMSFNLKCNVAHTYVFKFLAQLQSVPDVSETTMVSMSSAITKLMSTYYLCEGCLDFNAYEIATACLQFAFLFHGFFTPSTKHIMKKELDSVSNKGRMFDILDEMIIVSDVSTTLKPI